MTTVLPVFHVEIKMDGHAVIMLSVPSLDCVRVPGVHHGAEPSPARWVSDGPRQWRADYSAVVGNLDAFRIARFELAARRVS